MSRPARIGLLALAFALALAATAQTQPNADLGFKDTPILPGQKWHVHDPDRPAALHHPGHLAELCAALVDPHPSRRPSAEVILRRLGAERLSRRYGSQVTHRRRAWSRCGAARRAAHTPRRRERRCRRRARTRPWLR